MKKIVTLILASCLWLVGCNLNGNSGSQSIAIKKTDTKYQFTAEFPKRKTDKVFKYIKQSLNEDKLFSNLEDHKDTDVNLGDSIKFHLILNLGI
jgi:hypothetical protein